MRHHTWGPKKAASWSQCLFAGILENLGPSKGCLGDKDSRPIQGTSDSPRQKLETPRWQEDQWPWTTWDARDPCFPGRLGDKSLSRVYGGCDEQEGRWYAGGYNKWGKLSPTTIDHAMIIDNNTHRNSTSTISWTLYIPLASMKMKEGNFPHSRWRRTRLPNLEANSRCWLTSWRIFSFQATLSIPTLSTISFPPPPEGDPLSQKWKILIYYKYPVSTPTIILALCINGINPYVLNGGIPPK